MFATSMKRFLFFVTSFLIIHPVSVFCLDRIDLPLPGPKPEYVEGELIIKFKDSVEGKLKDKDNLHKDLGSKVKKEYAHIPTMQHIELKEGLTVEDAVKLYQKQDPDIEFVQPNYIYELCATYPSEYPSGQGLPYNLSKLQMPLVWDATQGSNSATVALIDTGIDSAHWDFVSNNISNIWADGNGNTGFNGVSNLPENVTDESGHGTHVAGIMGAAANNGGIVGVNWETEIYTCKVLNRTDSEIYNCVENIIYRKGAGDNIVAVNASWGSLGTSTSNPTHGALRANVKKLMENGILLVAAASNAGLSNANKANPDNDHVPWYPANLDLPNVIAVAATDQADNLGNWTYWVNQNTLADYESSYGRRSVHVGAPGIDINSTISSQNGYYDSTDLVSPPTSCNQHCSLSGTSMAAPQATGLAALIKARFMELDPGCALRDCTKDWIYIKNLILAGGDNLSSLSGKTITGKRINANGSFNCADKRIRSALPFYFDKNSDDNLDAVRLSALNINCALPDGTVTVTSSKGITLALYDDGFYYTSGSQNKDRGDMAAGDGTFSRRTNDLSILNSNLTYTYNASGVTFYENFYYPRIISLSPTSASQQAGISRTFTSVYRDPNGVNDVNGVFIMFRKDATGTSDSLIGYYDKVEKTLYLGNDAGDDYVKTGSTYTTCTPGDGGTIRNSQGSLNCGQTTIPPPGGTDLTVNWSFSFDDSFTGFKNVYLYATDRLVSIPA